MEGKGREAVAVLPDKNIPADKNTVFRWQNYLQSIRKSTPGVDKQQSKHFQVPFMLPTIRDH